jgi:hypothetical protein
MNRTLERFAAHADLRHGSRAGLFAPHAHRSFIAPERMP